ncbi:DAK2 domain-containing protein [Paenibacillus sp. N1-5-1-14]|uniref:DAK2 domain-containing protein n=1 Tax=Paenibacillus radicibacter TaxID=2972488 RepID=UPI0021597EBD|nr:DAK2 domain-containing protein [Paenibacillus radicibacter]MCR8641702.1 DAK2 domain-containing protein [Paenibacillus radicibacter]
MGKRFNTINGKDFMAMAIAGAEHLNRNVERVNGLNVFPVPDGDTGTNMSLTINSGIAELKRRPSSHIGQAAEALSKGLLMGARGNSGVILSQLFRGFSKYVHDFEEINPVQFAHALQNGVETAYKAVVKPVEGTVLTVSKDAAKSAIAFSKHAEGIQDLMAEVVEKGRESLNRTPDLLPVLKQVGVVDAGGEGLMCVYEGFLAVLKGQTVDSLLVDAEDVGVPESLDVMKEVIKNPAQTMNPGHEPRRAQAHMATEDIEFGYCTEFLVKLVPDKTKGMAFNEDQFRSKLSEHGDSLLVVADDDLVKVHIHAEYPGEVMTIAQKFGDLIGIKIENMREQHLHILQEEASEYDAYEKHAVREEEVTTPAAGLDLATEPNKPFGIIAVAMGEGITEIFTSVGVDHVISGGQTMNPSTEDFVKAIADIPADSIYILPNNSNIVMAAKQAADLVDDKKVYVIPTKTIPQGMAAILAFQEKAEPQVNVNVMTQAISNVRSGSVTYAVRDTSIDGVDIKENDFIGIEDGEIVVSEPTALDASKGLLSRMMDEGTEIVTILIGEDASEEETDTLVAYIQEMRPGVEVELYPGGQPIYLYLFSVE